MKHLLWAALVFLTATSGWAGALPTLQLAPSVSTVTTGEVLTMDLNIEGLGSPGSMEVGAFDSFIGFDPALLSATGASFSLFLGDPSLFEAITAFTAGPSYAEAADVSLLSVPELDALQPPSFTLATYSFVALGSGKVSFTYLGGPVTTDSGN